MEGIQIHLASVERELHDAWQRFCGDLEGVTVHFGSILDTSSSTWSLATAAKNPYGSASPWNAGSPGRAAT